MEGGGKDLGAGARRRPVAARRRGSASWWFTTPRPDERAGGEAIFYPPDPAGERHLAPARGAFWLYDERWRLFMNTVFSFDAWAISETRGEMPRIRE